METDNFKTHVFLVLVPHRDARGEIRKYTEALFKNGLTGVYTFPYIAPIALLAKPLTPDELKTTARNIRIAAAGEKFQTSETACALFLSDKNSLTLFGPRLSIEIDTAVITNTSEKIKTKITPAVIGAWLTSKTCGQQDCDGSDENIYSHSFPKISFRAAAIANMFWKTVNINGEICCKWKIGRLSWLPRSLQK
ncbi:MAG: hypothetical protein FWB77_00420 [Treponema sp.]|nr:hypothetical protein [Treponema sp.]